MDDRENDEIKDTAEAAKLPFDDVFSDNGQSFFRAVRDRGHELTAAGDAVGYFTAAAEMLDMLSSIDPKDFKNVDGVKLVAFTYNAAMQGGGNHVFGMIMASHNFIDQADTEVA